MGGEGRGGESLFSFSKNVLKLSYNNAKFTNLSGGNTTRPLFQRGEGGERELPPLVIMSGYAPRYGRSSC